VESDQIDVLALAVLGDLEEINDSLEARGARQVWSDVVQTDRQDRLDLDFTLFHTVSLAGRHMRAHPDADAAGDLTASDSVAQTSCEDHLKPSRTRNQQASAVTDLCVRSPRRTIRRRSPPSHRDTRDADWDGGRFECLMMSVAIATQESQM
jgi:hypothetical protein